MEKLAEIDLNLLKKYVRYKDGRDSLKVHGYYQEGDVIHMGKIMSVETGNKATFVTISLANGVVSELMKVSFYYHNKLSVGDYYFRPKDPNKEGVFKKENIGDNFDKLFGEYENHHHSFLRPKKMEEFGFELNKDPENGFFSYQNNGKVHWNKDYNREFPEPKGKVSITVNINYTRLSGETVPYIGIRQDGGTRWSYMGLCPNEDFLRMLLENIR
jgi:hypothetical protein